MIRICQFVVTTNRPEYLARTLDSQRNLDFTGCAVDRMLVDDFPKDRDDRLIRKLASDHGYNEVYLHHRNMSIGATWQEFWDRIRGRDYDYVWHQEDDVVILERVPVLAIVEVLKATPQASQAVLKRQPWYGHEVPATPLPDDLVFPDFRGEFNAAHYFFTPICSLYPMARVRYDYRAFYRRAYPNDPIFQGANVNEALIGKALIEGQGLRSLHLKNREGHNIIEHIGEYTKGRKLLPHEPGYQDFSGIDPDKEYWSGTVRLRTEPKP